MLNPQNIKVEKKDLEETWNNIVEDYYSKTNKKGYKNLISEEKEKWILRNKIVTCSVALILFNTPDKADKEEVSNTLKYFGYENLDFKKLESAVLKEKSKLEFLMARSNKSSKKEEVNFWRILSQVENALGRQLDIEKITLSYWIEIIKGIKEKNIEHGRQQRRNRKI